MGRVDYCSHVSGLTLSPEALTSIVSPLRHKDVCSPAGHTSHCETAGVGTKVTTSNEGRGLPVGKSEKASRDVSSHNDTQFKNLILTMTSFCARPGEALCQTRGQI